MGRHRKNKSAEFSIGNNSETKYPLSEVKIPFWLKATYKEVDNNGKPIYAGTLEENVRYLHYTKNEITKYFQEKGIEIIKFEEIIMRIPDLCEKCHNIGIPKIEEVTNKYDYHPRAGSPLFREGKQRTEVNRPNDWYLTYDHKMNGKLKKCKIAKFDKNHMIFINPSNRIIELHKHFFPYCAEWMKKLTAEA